jgi:hypothetical protein
LVIKTNAIAKIHMERLQIAAVKKKSRSESTASENNAAAEEEQFREPVTVSMMSTCYIADIGFWIITCWS